MKHIGLLHVRLTHEEWLALLFAIFCFLAALGMFSIAEAKPLADAQSLASAPARLPQTGTFPFILLVFGLGVVLAIVWLVLTFKKPKKLGGSKGDVW